MNLSTGACPLGVSVRLCDCVV